MKGEQENVSFLDQIVTLTLESISKNGLFDENTLGRLRGLFESGDLTKPQLVAGALSPDEDDKGNSI